MTRIVAHNKKNKNISIYLCFCFLDHYQFVKESLQTVKKTKKKTLEFCHWKKMLTNQKKKFTWFC